MSLNSNPLCLCVCSKYKLSSRASRQSNVDESSKFYTTVNEDMSLPHDAVGKPPSEASPITTRRRKNIGMLKSFKKPSSDTHCAACNEVCVLHYVCVCACVGIWRWA